MVRKKQLVSHAVRNVIEELEARQMLSATLALSNNEGLPNENRLVFNYIQNKNTNTPNVERDEETLTLKNTGTSTLTISSFTLSGPFAVVGTAPAAGTQIAAGGSLPVTIAFNGTTQSGVPAHSVNETNESTNTNGGAATTGSLTITSNDSTTPTQVVTLAGYYQSNSEDNEEPGINTIINTLFGYSTVLASSGQVPNYSNGQVDNDLPNIDSGSTHTAVYYGQEVYSPTWQAANSTLPVTLTEVATFHTQGNNVQVGYVNGSESSPTTHQLFTENGVEGQTLLPSATYSGSTSTGSPYSANIPDSAGPFGLRDDDEYSDNQINLNNGNTGGGGHHFRFYPLIDGSGNVVPNTYIVAQDYAILQSENYDFQDNVFILTNVVPTSTAIPPSPTNLTATSAADPTLTWTGVNASNLAGYNVYRSTNASGPFTKLTATPTTATTYTDTASPPSGVTLYYQVTAVSTAAAPNESAPDTTSTNTPTGPVANSFSVPAYEGQSISINLLGHATDSTPNATISPNSVAVYGVAAGDSAVVNHTTGVVTYTVRAGFTGTETFTYTVSDGSTPSAPGTVTLNVVAPTVTSPSINSITTETLGNLSASTGNTDVINVLASDVAVTSFNDGSLTVPAAGTAGAPAHGGVVIGTGDEVGEIVYTPAVGFIGSDSFKYTVADNNGQSGSATVTVYVGAEISKTTGNKVITYTDTDGTNVTAKLNLGTADLYFSGSGSLPGASNRGKLILGGQISLADAVLSGTTVASTFSLAGARHGAITLGGLHDSSAVGAISAPTANLTGDAGLYGGFRTLSVATITGTTLDVGPEGTNATTGAPVLNGTLSVAGAVTGTSLNDNTIPLNLVKAAAWTNSGTDVLASITAPSIRTLSIGGEFDPSLSLTGAGTELTTATIKGAAKIGYWNLQGSATTVSLGSAATGWGGLTAAGSVRTFAVRAGGFSSSLAVAGTLTTFTDNGGLTGSITAGAAGTVHVVGAVTAGSLAFTGAGTSLRTLSVTGAITGTTIATVGSLNTLTAASLSDSNVLVGTVTAASAPTPTVASVTLATLGGSTLGTLSLATKTGFAFSDSQVLASAIRSASLGSVDGTTTGGVATKTVLKSITDRESGTLVRVTPSSTTHVFGDFQIRLVTA